MPVVCQYILFFALPLILDTSEWYWKQEHEEEEMSTLERLSPGRSTGDRSESQTSSIPPVLYGHIHSPLQHTSFCWACTDYVSFRSRAGLRLFPSMKQLSSEVSSPNFKALMQSLKQSLRLQEAFLRFLLPTEGTWVCMPWSLWGIVKGCMHLFHQACIDPEKCTWGPSGQIHPLHGSIGQHERTGWERMVLSGGPCSHDLTHITTSPTAVGLALWETSSKAYSSWLLSKVRCEMARKTKPLVWMSKAWSVTAICRQLRWSKASVESARADNLQFSLVWDFSEK